MRNSLTFLFRLVKIYLGFLIAVARKIPANHKSLFLVFIPVLHALQYRKAEATVKITEIMNRNVLTVCQDQPVSQAVHLMEKHKVGGLVVLAPDGTLAGIVTSRDLRGVPVSQPISEIMSRDLTVIDPATSLWEAMDIMNQAGVERLPVVAAKKLIGIVTKIDLLTTIARHTDSLTGLYTAAYLRDTAERLLQTAPEICIIFFDIDDFGLINKLLGHSQGDQCLRLVANLLCCQSKPGQDFPCRYGGDEFAVVSTRPLEDAVVWARRLTEEAEKNCKSVSLSLSAGIAGGRRRSFRPGTNPADVVESLINLASLASTRAKLKRSGVEVASGEPPLPN